MGGCCSKRSDYPELLLLKTDDYRIVKIAESYDFMKYSGKLKPPDRLLPAMLSNLVRGESEYNFNKFWEACKKHGISQYIYL